jgi:hypothetical protein
MNRNFSKIQRRSKHVEVRSGVTIVHWKQFGATAITLPIISVLLWIIMDLFTEMIRGEESIPPVAGIRSVHVQSDLAWELNRDSPSPPHRLCMPYSDSHMAKSEFLLIADDSVAFSIRKSIEKGDGIARLTVGGADHTTNQQNASACD